MKKQFILLAILVVLVTIVMVQRRQQKSFVASEPAGSVAVWPRVAERVSPDR